MNTEEYHRKLTAILSADVQGYSRLMGEDEESTVRTLTAYRTLMSSLVQSHRGHVVDTPGDNLLAKFDSVMDAVRCAVEIQEELRIMNAELPENRKMQFRIGINLGDVIEEGDRIYGDGINVAARIEGLAEGGGICISGFVYGAIKNKLSFSFEFIGEHSVKNIKDPVRVYRIRMEPDAEAPKVKEKASKVRTWPRLALPAVVICILGAVAVWYFSFRQAPVVSDVEEESRTIAVLPFADLSPGKDHEYFADGIAEELLNSLSRISELEVRGRTSSFYFKDKNEDLDTISKMLNVDYILEGSVRKADEQVRIAVQLINTHKDAHIWSKTYERTMDDIFAIQDDIAQSVADALQISLGVGELGSTPGMTCDIAAYDAYLVSRSLFGGMNVLQAIKYLEKAVTLDPDFAICWYELAKGYMIMSKVRGEEFNKKAKSAYSRVVELLPGSDLALELAAMQSSDMVGAERIYEKALALNPAKYETNFAYGSFLNDVGRPREAIDYFKRCVRLEPLAPITYLALGSAYELGGNIDAAATAFKKARELTTEPMEPNHGLLALALEGNNRVLIGEYVAMLRNDEFLGDTDISETKDINQVMHALLDKPEEAVAELRLSLNDPISKPPPNELNIGECALWASYFGDHKLALQIYRKEIGSSSIGIGKIWEPIHKGMRRLPGFKTLVQEIGLVDYWRTSGEWGDFCRPVGDDDFVCE